MTTTTIDCQTCPVRGRHCGDCFVPVLGRLWLEDPRPHGEAHPTAPAEDESAHAHAGVALDSDELAAVGAFVRAGLVHPEEASRTRAQLTSARRYAAG
jgi:hypothetical protein